ncbi:MAG: DUF362 domain-containing protein [Firmicutes bacterium]|nr:DUF362 domain-containing protein [Bacillota bacterium]
MELPLMALVRQNFPGEHIKNIEEQVLRQLQGAGLHNRIQAGQKIGITAGSRGITNIVRILHTVVKAVKATGACPLLIPSMGSHGGGTTEGQLAILHKLGINAEIVGAEIWPETNTTVVGYIENNIPIHVNKAALECDGVIVINRVKPHTSFHGPVESGIHKMIAVGLGGPSGAEAIHRQGAPALPEIIPAMATKIMRHINLIMGLAIIENSYEKTRKIAAVLPEELADKEGALLEEARRTMPSLPLTDIDLLIIDQMGKNFSGTGMDTNIIGRLRIQGLPEPESPRIKRIAVLDLSPETDGNANGIGLADFTTRRLVDKINFPATYKNNITSTFTQRAMIPITMDNDREVVNTALKSIGLVNPGQARVVRVRNTLHLAEIQVSESIMEEVLSVPHVELIGNPAPMQFDGVRPPT